MRKYNRTSWIANLLAQISSSTIDWVWNFLEGVYQTKEGSRGYMPSIVLTPSKAQMVAEKESTVATSGIPKLASFRFLTADNSGSLSEVSLGDPSLINSTQEQAEDENVNETNVKLVREAKGAGVSKGDHLVQKIASGRLRDVDVTALARKDGRIDILETMSGKLLTSLRNAEMKKGVHRWVGLAVAHDGIFACTSAGDMRFFSIDQEEGSKDATLAMKGDCIKRELPEPLQMVSFEPKSDPTHFAYGGEEIPLSVWDARQAISSNGEVQDGESNENASSSSRNGSSGTHTVNGMEEEVDAATANKQRKRKRIMENRAKARELMLGEIWRAKNLPNDALSLPQRPDILSIAFLGSPHLIATGTRTGHIRIFDTSSQRKHTHEYRAFGATQEKIPVKILLCSERKTELIAADTTGKLFVLDVRSGSVLYQYKGINGAVLSMEALPAIKNNPGSSYLITASADRLLRLHSVPIDSQAATIGTSAEDVPLRKSTKQKGQTLSSQFMREGANVIAWDGVVPEAEQSVKSNSENVEEDIDEALPVEDDGMWDAMATIDEDDVQQHSDRQEARSKRRR